MPPAPGAILPGAPAGIGGAIPPAPGAFIPGAPIGGAAALPPGLGVLVPGMPGPAAAVVNPGLGGLIPAAPIADAAAALPTPPIGVLPNLAQGVATLLSPPKITIPGIPGFGIPLPKTISAPHSLLCIGTEWSAPVPGGQAGAVGPVPGGQAGAVGPVPGGQAGAVGPVPEAGIPVSRWPGN